MTAYRPDKPFITRFAPSPNGLLHLGHAYSALVGQHLAGGSGKTRAGRFLLRIEDIDLGRRRTDFIQAIYDDLKWLGIEWDGAVMMQSTRFDIYQQALKKLQQLDVVYPCWATRQEIRTHIENQPNSSHGSGEWLRDPDGAPLYPDFFRDFHRNLDAPTRSQMMQENPLHAWRLDMRKAHALAEARHKGALFFTELSTGEKIKVDPSLYGDVIIARKDVPTSYHLSVVVDDAAQNINLVTRGMDLFAATHIHRVLQVLLDAPAPAYFHHQLIRNETGRKLSKTASDEGFAQWRQSGTRASGVIKALPDMPTIIWPTII